MKMTIRWYGEGNDTVRLQDIRQIPNVSGVAAALHKVPVGEVWEIEDILTMQKQVHAAGLELEVIESVNVHEEIKLGGSRRDQYIDHYIRTIRNLARAGGIKVICYNFMPVFDWTRSSVNTQLSDGSMVLDYNEEIVQKINPSSIVRSMQKESRGLTMPGWEPEKLALLDELFDRYQGFTEEKLRQNLSYFLKRIIPVCEETDIKMALHPDDPPWEIFGLPRIVKNGQDYQKIIDLVDSVCNGITLCTGCLAANRENDIPGLINDFAQKGRLHFVHLRNINFYGPHSFYEVSHLSKDGVVDMFQCVKALMDNRSRAYIRPDHGRMIWGEKARPGYGLYDRALGVAYINGLMEAITKSSAN